MEQLSERERALIARGDVAITVLKALVKVLSNPRDTMGKTAEQLNAILARQPQQQTLLAVVAEVSNRTYTTLHECVDMIENTLLEIDSFVEQADVNIRTEDAEANVLEGIRQSSEVYTNKTDDELRNLVGL